MHVQEVAHAVSRAVAEIQPGLPQRRAGQRVEVR